MSRQAEALCIFQEADTAHREWHLLPGSELAQGLLIAFGVALQHFSELWRKPEMSGAGSIATNQSHARA
jgi:hypothetical protein